MVPTPDDLVVVSLEVLLTEFVVNPDQSALHLGDYRLGRVHVGAGLWVGRVTNVNRPPANPARFSLIDSKQFEARGDKSGLIVNFKITYSHASRMNSSVLVMSA